MHGLSELTLLYKIPPPAAWMIQPIEENTPKIAATIWPWENIAIVLINPAEPAAVYQQCSEFGSWDVQGIPMTMYIEKSKWNPANRK